VTAAKIPRGSKKSRCGQQRKPRTIQREQVWTHTHEATFL
jgi:hypothetical protein